MTLVSYIKRRPSDCFYAAALCLHFLFWNPCVVSGEKYHFNVEVRQMAFPPLPVRNDRALSFHIIIRLGVQKRKKTKTKNTRAHQSVGTITIMPKHGHIIGTARGKERKNRGCGGGQKCRASLVCRVQWNRRMLILITLRSAS